LIIENDLCLKFISKAEATIFLESFSPELNSLPMKRSTFEVKQIDNQILFKIHSDDAVAFRATINNFLQFAHVVEQTIDICSKQ
jgi:tRNA threonylcarbamoyladenosine modification (KEOPS) complex  Pcc1 subunit